MEDIPTELISVLFQLLDPPSATSLALTSRRLQVVFAQNFSSLSASARNTPGLDPVEFSPTDDESNPYVLFSPSWYRVVAKEGHAGLIKLALSFSPITVLALGEEALLRIAAANGRIDVM